jgi:hypothetical protein
VLKHDDSNLGLVKLETADKILTILHCSCEALSANLTCYVDDRNKFVGNETFTIIDFLESTAGGYINNVGIEPIGFKASLSYLGAIVTHVPWIDAPRMVALYIKTLRCK